MTTEMQQQSDRLVTKLQTEFSGPDRTSTSQANWHAIIRQNWDDPAWRAAQGTRMGEVPFVQDAMTAFGIPKQALSTHPVIAPSLPSPMVDQTMPIPPDPQATPTTQTAPGVSA